MFKISLGVNACLLIAILFLWNEVGNLRTVNGQLDADIITAKAAVKSCNENKDKGVEINDAGVKNCKDNAEAVDKIRNEKDSKIKSLNLALKRLTLSCQDPKTATEVRNEAKEIIDYSNDYVPTVYQCMHMLKDRTGC